MHEKPPPGSTHRIPRHFTLPAALIATSIVVAVVPRAAMAQAAGDSVALRERVAAYQRVWNTRDPAAVAAFFAEDADLVMGNQPEVRGRGAIETWWRSYFAVQEAERRGTFEVISARLLAPAVAVVEIASTTGGRGGALPVRKARGTWLLRRRGGAWLISAMRGFPTEKDHVELRPSLEAAESLRPQIRAFVDRYQDAFNRHDPDALSTFFRDDADIIIREHPGIRGARAIRAWWRVYFNQPRPYHALMIISDIRMMADNVALLNVIGTGALPEPPDRLLPTRLARATWVLVHQNGEWRIAALWVLPGEADRVVRDTSG